MTAPPVALLHSCPQENRFWRGKSPAPLARLRGLLSPSHPPLLDTFFGRAVCGRWRRNAQASLFGLEVMFPSRFEEVPQFHCCEKPSPISHLPASSFACASACPAALFNYLRAFNGIVCRRDPVTLPCLVAYPCLERNGLGYDLGYLCGWWPKASLSLKWSSFCKH